MRQFLSAKKLQDLTSTTISSSFDHRSIVPHGLVHRMEPFQVWCAPGSRTYITVALTAGEVSLGSTARILAVALRRINSQLAAHGDSLISSGVFIEEIGQSELYLVNSNNHQQSWAVVGAALLALRNFLLSVDTIAGGFTGGVIFTVFDGTNEVGQGTIE